MGKNLALLKPRVTFPLTSVGPRLSVVFQIGLNVICIVQIDAGREVIIGFGSVSQSHEWSLHVVLIGRLRKV